MLNRPITHLKSSERSPRTSDAAWNVDQNPTIRLTLLFAIFAAFFSTVAGRLVYLQTARAEAFQLEENQHRVLFEAIPTRNGRILASDGRVLAYDVEQFQILAHYRWLEDPPNPNWLRKAALSRLGTHERYDADLVAHAKQQVLSSRNELWRSLAELTDTPESVLAKNRHAIQTRIERMVASVEKNRVQRRRLQEESAHQNLDENAPWWKRTWELLATTVTTSPDRGSVDPLILPEQSRYYELIDSVPLEIAARIKQHPEQFPGLQIKLTTHRFYPEQTLASHVVGSRTVLREDEGHPHDGMHSGEEVSQAPGISTVGRSGVERSYDYELAGVVGKQRLVVNSQGEIIQTEVLRAPRSGKDLNLTLSIDLQQTAERILDEAISKVPSNPNHGVAPGGAIVALDVHSGAVVAAATAPRFDVNMMVNSDSQAWQELNNDPRRPFFPRATHMTLPPGSIFKTLTSVALLESGKIQTDQTVHCRGYLDHPHSHRCYIFRHYGIGHHDVGLHDAICQSCNVYFFSMAREIGPEGIVDWAQRFGFDQPTGIDLPGEQGGHLPRPTGNESAHGSSDSGHRHREPWYPGDTLGLAIGQSRLTVTPMQIARMMAAVANDGWLVTPHVVREVISPESSNPFERSFRFTDRSTGSSDLTTNQFTPRRIPGLSTGTLREVRRGLEMVVGHSKGTGHRYVHRKDIPIAGKTGTAEVGGGKPDHAWFAGYVPANDPKYAFVVVLEHAGSGGRMAGPVAKELIQGMVECNLLHPENEGIAGSRNDSDRAFAASDAGRSR